MLLVEKRKAMLALIDKVKKISPDKEADEYDTQLGELEELIEQYCKEAEQTNIKGYIPLPMVAMFGTPQMECFWLIGAPLPKVTIKNKDGSTEEVRRTIDIGSFGISAVSPFFTSSSLLLSAYPEAAALANILTMGLTTIENDDIQAMLDDTSKRFTEDELSGIVEVEEID